MRMFSFVSSAVSQDAYGIADAGVFNLHIARCNDTSVSDLINTEQSRGRLMGMDTAVLEFVCLNLTKLCLLIELLGDPIYLCFE